MLAIIFVSLGNLSAQVECGTPDITNEQFLQFLQVLATNNNTPESDPAPLQPFLVPIHYTIVRNSAGFSEWDDHSNNSESLYSLIDYANQHFSDCHIFFYICSVSYVYSDDLFDVGDVPYSPDHLALYDLTHRDDAINVYCVNGMGSVGGLAYGPMLLSEYNNMFLISAGSVFSENTFTHEMGHYFGLAHTFNNSLSESTQVNTPYQSETQSGNNICYTCDENEQIPTDWDCLIELIHGDGICDTPTDPGTVICGLGCSNPNGPCGGLEDPTGVPYNPDPYNIMGYYGCTPEHFSQGQKNRIWETFQFHPDRNFLMNSYPDCSNIGRVDRVYYDNEIQQFEPLPDVAMEVINNGTSPNNQTTNTNGNFNAIIDRYIGVDEDLDVKTTEVLGAVGETLNGITMADLVRIQDHVLNFDYITEPEYRIAADVNYDGAIGFLDLNTMTEVLLESQDNFPAGSWRFVPEYFLGQQFSFKNDYENNPFSATWDDGYGNTRVYKPTAGSTEISYLDEFRINKLNVDIFNDETWNFRGIKVGDVDGSAVPGITNPPGTGDPVIISIEPEIYGGYIKYKFKVEGFEDIRGYQMIIDFDKVNLEYFESLAKDLSGVHPGLFGTTDTENGIIRTLWYDNNGESKTMPDFNEIFQLVFDGIGDYSSATVQLLAEGNGNQRITNPAAMRLKNFAIDKNGLIRPIIMKEQIQIEKKSIFSLDVSPNPFKDEFNLNIQMLQSETIEIEIHNIVGQLVSKQKKDLSSGNHNILISELQDSEDGIFIVSVKDTKNIFTQKVIRAN